MRIKYSNEHKKVTSHKTVLNKTDSIVLLEKEQPWMFSEIIPPHLGCHQEFPLNNLRPEKKAESNTQIALNRILI
ncbi:MAG: hypothetical protein MUP98_07710, partial [Candidatus Aminicenantes bacterium]|nr:hypothetical protein [Candidatus Aminicenantes bacterium]